MAEELLREEEAEARKESKCKKKKKGGLKEAPLLARWVPQRSVNRLSDKGGGGGER